MDLAFAVIGYIMLGLLVLFMVMFIVAGYFYVKDYIPYEDDEDD